MSIRAHVPCTHVHVACTLRVQGFTHFLPKNDQPWVREVVKVHMEAAATSGQPSAANRPQGGLKGPVQPLQQQQQQQQQQQRRPLQQQKLNFGGQAKLAAAAAVPAEGLDRGLAQGGSTQQQQRQAGLHMQLPLKRPRGLEGVSSSGAAASGGGAAGANKSSRAGAAGGMPQASTGTTSQGARGGLAGAAAAAAQMVGNSGGPGARDVKVASSAQPPLPKAPSMALPAALKRPRVMGTPIPASGLVAKLGQAGVGQGAGCMCVCACVQAGRQAGRQALLALLAGVGAQGWKGGQVVHL